MTMQATIPSRIPHADHRLAEVSGERELVEPVGQPERGRDEVDEVRRHDDEGGDLRGQRGAEHAARPRTRRQRSPRRTARARPCPSMLSPALTPPEAAPAPMPSANSTVMTTTRRARRRRRPRTQVVRRIGVARSASSRSSVSSDAHLATSVAAGEPDGDEHELGEQLEPAAGAAQVEVREDLLEGGQQRAVAAQLVDHRADERGQHRAHQEEADAPGERPRQHVAERPAHGTMDAQREAGQARQGEAGRDAEVAAREQRDPDRRGRRRRSGAVASTGSQSYMPTSGMWFDGPAERADHREDVEAGDAVGQPQRRASRSPRCPPAPARPRIGASRNAKPPKNIARDPIQRPNPRPETERDRVAQGGVTEHHRADRARDGEDRHRQPQQGQVGGELLERDPALAQRRRGDDVEAAPAGPRWRASRRAR